MKKIIGGIVAVLAVAIIGLSIYRTVLSYLPENENDYSEEVSYLNDEVDFKMYLYGEDINFPKELHYEKIADVDMEKINLDADYVYLIINDLNGTTDLKENDIKEIMALTEQKKNFNFFYIGKEKLKLFQKYKDDIDFQDTDWSLGEIIWEGDRLNYFGVWTEDDNQYLEKNPNSLYQSILESIKQCIESNEGKND